MQVHLNCSCCTIYTAQTTFCTLPSGNGIYTVVSEWICGMALSHRYRASRLNLWPRLPHSTDSRMSVPTYRSAGRSTSLLLRIRCCTAGAATPQLAVAMFHDWCCWSRRSSCGWQRCLGPRHAAAAGGCHPGLCCTGGRCPRLGCAGSSRGTASHCGRLPLGRLLAGALGGCLGCLAWLPRGFGRPLFSLQPSACAST